jgi:hypothetical protein
MRDLVGTGIVVVNIARLPVYVFAYAVAVQIDVIVIPHAVHREPRFGSAVNVDARASVF